MAFHLKFLFSFVVSRASATRAPSWGRLPSGSLPQSILKTLRNSVATLIDLEPFRTRVATLIDFDCCDQGSKLSAPNQKKLVPDCMAFHLKFLFTFVVSRASATRGPSRELLPLGFEFFGVPGSGFVVWVLFGTGSLP